MYYSTVGILALLMLFIVNLDILGVRGNSPDKPVWKVYRRFLLAVLVYYVTDILWGFLEEWKLPALLFADTTVYFVAMAAGILYWAEFTVAYLEVRDAFGRFLRIASRVIAGLVTASALVNIFLPVLFTVDSNTVYEALPVRYVMLVAQILILLLLSVYAFTSMSRPDVPAEKRPRFRALALFGIVMAACLMIQLWYPLLPLYSIGYMLATGMLHSVVVSNEMEEYRKGLEEAGKVAELKATITSLLDNVPGMTFTKDAHTGVYLACNQAFADYAHKKTPEDVLGLTDADMFDAETAAHFVEADRMALSLSKPYIFFEDVPDAAGNQRQLQTTKLKYTDASGRLCVLGMCEDITDLVRIRHENAMTKEAYENAVSSGLMFTHIAQTLARDYNDMFQVNTDTEEFIEFCRTGKDETLTEARRGWHFFSDCVAEMSAGVFVDDRESFRQAMTRKTLMTTLREKKTFVMTFRRIGDNGPFYVTMKISRMENDEQFIIIGITDVDAEMRDAMSKSEVLAEALAAAEESNKARSVFLSSMSHEIRTPMNAIIGLDTLALKNEHLDDSTRDHLEKIGHSARHLLSLINDILDMSRIESGHIALRRDEFRLDTLLEQVSGKVRPLCEEKGLSFACRTLSEIPRYLIGDSVKLSEVLNNILSNAVKFTPAPGSVLLTVEQTASFADQATLRFCVKDTGIGMDKEYIHRIFEPFSQEDSTNRNKYGGTGLGMAITKRVVEIMNGTVTVESEKGIGTAVTVTVTLKTSDHDEETGIGEIDPGLLRVLVVDDEPIDAEHARMVLEEAGIRADACTSGQEALVKMENQHTRHKPYNLVLMDWSMPGMSGLEATEEIYRRYRDETTVVVLTSYNWDEIQEEARRVGVTSFLTKPLSTENLLAEIERLSRRSGQSLFMEKRRANLAGRRILLAEDLESNAEIMMDILEMENIVTDHAENGRIAVEMFRQSAPGTYAAILMDVRMPEMDGLEATQTIRAMTRSDAKRIPIIALTANAFDEDVQRSLQSGMNAHLSKPVESDHLIQVLGELVFQAETNGSGRNTNGN